MDYVTAGRGDQTNKRTHASNAFQSQFEIELGNTYLREAITNYFFIIPNFNITFIFSDFSLYSDIEMPETIITRIFFQYFNSYRRCRLY